MPTVFISVTKLAESKSFRRTLGFLAALSMASVFYVDHLTEWDSWDYTAMAINGQSSDLFLGRWWFIAVMRVAYRVGQLLFNLSPLEGYRAMQLTSALMMGGAVVALMTWTFQLTKSRSAEVLVSTLVVPSPLIIAYTSAVLTEGMTLLFLTLACISWENVLSRANENHKLPIRPLTIIDRPENWAFLAGLAFGVTIDIREPTIVLAAWPLISCLSNNSKTRWKFLAIGGIGACITLAIGIFGAWAWCPRPDGYINGIAEWLHDVTHEREQFSIHFVGRAGFLVLWALVCAPVAAVLLIPSIIWAINWKRRLSWLSVSLVPYTTVTLFSASLDSNPRYILPAVWLACPIVAAALASIFVQQSLRKLATTTFIVFALGCSIIAACWGKIESYYLDYVKGQGRAYQSLLMLQKQGTSSLVVVPLLATPVANYLSAIGVKDFDVIPGGWHSPGDALEKTIADRLRSGADVYVNFERNETLRRIRDDGDWNRLMAIASKYDLDRRAWPMVRLVPQGGIPSQNESW
jgi:hypothetical protein